jgi:hypothetical protein
MVRGAGIAHQRTAAGYACAMVSAAILADAVPPVVQAFGRLHPLVIHLPLGLVLGAFLVEAARKVQGKALASPFTSIALGLAAAGAVAASATGWFFAMQEGSGDSLFWHRWLGILVSVLLVALAWMAVRATRPDTGGQVTPVMRGGLLAVTALAAWVGHLGGDMVWGKNYLLQPFMQHAGGADGAADGADAKQSSAAGDAGAPGFAADDPRMTFYASKVLPLLQSRCYECHGNGKHKGGLQMDVRSKVVTRDGGGHWIVHEGDAAGSLMIARCLLPAADDEAMPPEGDRLAPEQLEILQKWIADGAVMPAGDAGAMAAAPAADRGRARAPRAEAADGGATLPPLTPDEIAEAAALRDRGINATPVSQGSSGFSVSIPGGKSVGDSDISALFPIASRIEELSLARSSVSDAEMMQFPPMPGVRSIRVDNTQLSDTGITAVLSRTLDVETVNLVSTGATDAIFTMLNKLPNLKTLYVYDTRITAAGIDRFRTQHPGVRIVVGQSVPGTSGTEGPPIGP